MGMPNYNPCSKYDYLYKALLHNMNYVTWRADMDGTSTNLPGGLEDIWESVGGA